MTTASARPGLLWGSTADLVRGATWSRGHGRWLIRTTLLMTLLAIPWLGYQSWRLLLDESRRGAIDLKHRMTESRDWTSGKDPRDLLSPYPPATYVILWPLVGWLPLGENRILWFLVNVASLSWLMRILERESLAGSRAERRFLATLVVGNYATGACIGNGQLIVPLLAPMVAGLLLTVRRSPGLQADLSMALLILLSLVKPAVTAPFFWIVMFVPGRPRPALLGIGGYSFLTIAASWVSGSSVSGLVRSFLTIARDAVDGGVASLSHGNLQSLLSTLGLGAWLPLGSMLLLVAAGLFVAVHRRRDIWLLIGVCALVSRFWTYHGWYDDVLLVLPVISLMRLRASRVASGGARGVVTMLVALTVVALLPPGGTYLFPPPWNQVYVAGQVLVWLSMLGFLLWITPRTPERAT